MRMFRKINRYIFGKNVLTRNLYILYVKYILAKLKNDEVGVICDYNLGETYLFCSMLDDFKDKNNVDKVVVISNKKYHQDIFEMFSENITRWHIYPGIQKRSFWNMREVKTGSFFYLHDRYDPNVSTMAQREMNFMQHLKKTTHLNPDAKINHYQIKKNHKVKAKALFDQLHLKEKKTVLISPEAHSCSYLDKKLCRDMCDRLREKGYDVFLNIINSDNEIPSIKTAFLPLIIARPFCDLCGHVIAIRSGFCDVISGSIAQSHIIYPDQTYKYVFSMKEIISSDNIREYVLNQISAKDLVEMIMDCM